MSYLSDVMSLRDSAKPKSDNQTLLSKLVSLIQTKIPTNRGVVASYNSHDEADIVTMIRDYIHYIRSLKSIYNSNYDPDEIDLTISQLSSIIPTAPSKNALINSLKIINSKNPITVTSYGATMTALKNVYGNALDTNRADGVIRDFIKSNLG